MKCRLLESFAYLAFPPILPIVESFALTAFPVPYVFNSTEKPTGCKAAFLDKGGDHSILPKWLRSSVQGFDRGEPITPPLGSTMTKSKQTFQKSQD